MPYDARVSTPMSSPKISKMFGAACAAPENPTALAITVVRNPAYFILVSRKAVKQAVTTGAAQHLLTTATTAVDRVP